MVYHAACGVATKCRRRSFLGFFDRLVLLWLWSCLYRIRVGPPGRRSTGDTPVSFEWPSLAQQQGLCSVSPRFGQGRKQICFRLCSATNVDISPRLWFLHAAATHTSSQMSLGHPTVMQMFCLRTLIALGQTLFSTFRSYRFLLGLLRLASSGQMNEACARMDLSPGFSRPSPHQRWYCLGRSVRPLV